jgi:enamine deaminase RidA (YjgF/YER057c/UK114 family)
MASAEDRLRELGIELPDPLPTAGLYVPARREGSLVFLSGHGPVKLDGSGLVTGKVGRDVSVDEARDAAHLTGLHLLSSLRAELGSLDAVRSVLKLLGMVNGAPGFDQTPTVIDGCSRLLLDVFGEEAGRHARSAVGLAELPFGMSVEIELIVAV